jgi:hypothetical protein
MFYKYFKSPTFYKSFYSKRKKCTEETKQVLISGYYYIILVQNLFKIIFSILFHRLFDPVYDDDFWYIRIMFVGLLLGELTNGSI